MHEERKLLTVGELKEIARQIPDHIPHDVPLQIHVCNTVIIVKDVYGVLQVAKVNRMPEPHKATAPHAVS